MKHICYSERKRDERLNRRQLAWDKAFDATFLEGKGAVKGNEFVSWTRIASPKI